MSEIKGGFICRDIFLELNILRCVNDDCSVTG